MPKPQQRSFTWLKTKSNSGFTLIELLIVIVIIAILVAILAVSYTTIQRNARDSQRRSDLQAVAGALERFYGDNSNYPSADAGRIAYNSDCTVSGTPSAEDWGSGDLACDPDGTGVRNYVRQLPEDPIGTNPYCYEMLASNQQYRLYAQMEGSGNLTPPGSCDGVSYNYRITSND